MYAFMVMPMEYDVVSDDLNALVGLKVTEAVKERCRIADETVGVYTEGHKESAGFKVKSDTLR